MPPCELGGVCESGEVGNHHMRGRDLVSGSSVAMHVFSRGKKSDVGHGWSPDGGSYRHPRKGGRSAWASFTLGA